MTAGRACSVAAAGVAWAACCALLVAGANAGQVRETATTVPLMPRGMQPTIDRCELIWPTLLTPFFRPNWIP